MGNKIEIITRWGIPADPISIQLREFGIIIPHEKLYDHVKESINQLDLSSIFTDSQISALYKRASSALTKEIQETLNKMSEDDYYRAIRKLERNKTS